MEVLRRMAPLGALASALVLSLSLAACSSEEEVAEPEPTIPEEVLWAGSVCTAFDDLLGTVDAVGDDLSYEPTADAEVFDQYVTQLQAQMADVNGAIEELAFTVGQAPVDVNHLPRRSRETLTAHK